MDTMENKACRFAWALSVVTCGKEASFLEVAALAGVLTTGFTLVEQMARDNPGLHLEFRAACRSVEVEAAAAGGGSASGALEDIMELFENIEEYIPK